MKPLEFTKMEKLQGGKVIAKDCDAVYAVGVISCVGAAFWPIGTLIFGPTCGGVILGAALASNCK